MGSIYAGNKTIYNSNTYTFSDWHIKAAGSLTYTAVEIKSGYHSVPKNHQHLMAILKACCIPHPNLQLVVKVYPTA